MIRIENEYINNFLCLEPFLRGSISTNKVGKWSNDKIGKFEYCTANVGGEKYRCWFNEMIISQVDNKNLHWHSVKNQNPEDKGRGFIVGFLIIRCHQDVKIDNITDVYKFYYNKIRNCNYNLLDDDDFHEQLLKDENEHYLYTKERLFPFFDEEAREILTKFTRNFFKYAQKQGCVGEFVEDIKEKKIELPEWYKTINSIFYLFTSNGYIDEKYITIIGDTILDYTLNYKIRYKYDEIVRMTKGTNFQYAYYMMSTCYNVIYPEIENKENRLNWCIMCARLFDKKEETWYKHWNDNSEVDGNFQKKIRVILSNR